MFTDKMLKLTIIGLLFLLPVSEVTNANYLDTENSNGNLFSAASLDFSLRDSADGELSAPLFNIPDLSPEDSETKTIILRNDGSLDFRYSVGVEREASDEILCENLVVEVSKNEILQYSGDLLGLSINPAGVFESEENIWDYKLSLYDSSILYQGKECNFSFKFFGWQLDSDGSWGLTDTENISSVVVAGYWEAPKLLSPADNYLALYGDPWFSDPFMDWSYSLEGESGITFIYQSANSSAVNPDGSFVSPVYTSSPLSSSIINASGTPNGEYFWHVRAVINGTIFSPWSETWKLTVDDTPPLGKLLIRKIVVGGSLEPSDFDLLVSDANDSELIVTGSSLGVEVELIDGEYSVSEEINDDYQTTYSDDCDGTIERGDSKICEVTNTYIDNSDRIAICHHASDDPSNWNTKYVNPNAWPTHRDNHGDTEGECAPLTSGVVLNEILPNPSGSDSAEMPGGEWVELYNNGLAEVDLKDYYLYDSNDSSEFKIKGVNTNTGDTKIAPSGFLVVYRNKDGKFSLNNDGDTIRLYNGKIGQAGVSEQDSVTYVGPVTEGKSIARIPDGTGPWIDPIPTPGEPNEVEQTVFPESTPADLSIPSSLEQSLTESEVISTIVNEGEKSDGSVNTSEATPAATTQNKSLEAITPLEDLQSESNPNPTMEIDMGITPPTEGTETQPLTTDIPVEKPIENGQDSNPLTEEIPNPLAVEIVVTQEILPEVTKSENENIVLNETTLEANLDNTSTEGVTDDDTN